MGKGGGKNMKYNVLFYIICVLVGMNLVNALHNKWRNRNSLSSLYDLIVADGLAITWILYTYIQFIK